ncbi:MAG: dipeptide ABC transporter ATP-binding protein [Proteobacteria bacterium]|nr:dipeptide ABC transporter ATP-binding protein [Pseudomonadota bacterium]
MSAAIEGRNLKRYYPVKDRGIFAKSSILKALDGASFSLGSGKTLAIVGESGCGKSTLARLATMIEKPTEGNIFISGIDPHANNGAEISRLRQDIQMIFQDPYGSLNPRKKIGTIIEEPIVINRKMPAAERRQLAESMLSKVGLRPEHYDRYPHMFSGGQRQRIAIARALVLKPKILIADEPVSALDISVRAAVTELLMDIQRRSGTTMLFISHDLSIVRYLSDRVVVMYLGHVMEQGSTDEIFSPPYHPYTEALLSAVPIADTSVVKKHIVLEGDIPSAMNPPSGCPFQTRCPRKSQVSGDICEREVPPMKDMSPGHKIKCHLPQEIFDSMEEIFTFDDDAA